MAIKKTVSQITTCECTHSFGDVLHVRTSVAGEATRARSLLHDQQVTTNGTEQVHLTRRDSFALGWRCRTEVHNQIL